MASTIAELEVEKEHLYQKFSSEYNKQHVAQEKEKLTNVYPVRYDPKTSQISVDLVASIEDLIELGPQPPPPVNKGGITVV